MQMLNICLQTYFTFDGEIYEQIKGTMMGSQMSGVIVKRSVKNKRVSKWAATDHDSEDHMLRTRPPFSIMRSYHK